MRTKSIRAREILEKLYWPAAGNPQAVLVNNGRDFRSDAFQSVCADWGISVEYRPPGRAHHGGHIERLIGTIMGAVHVLPGTTQLSPKDRGDYTSSGNAAMTLAEFEDWLHLEICRYHSIRHGGLWRAPLAAWADLGGEGAGRKVVDTEAFRISFPPKVGISLESGSSCFLSAIGATHLVQ